VECWGLDSFGTLGDVTEPTHVWRGPVVVAGVIAPSGTYLTKLTGSANAVCTRADAAVFCWGVDAQLFTPVPPDDVSFMPREVEGLAEPSTIATSGSHACSALPDGTAVCWGANSSGQLGTGASTSTTTPAPVLLSGG
jgi:hypothetical protein